MQSYRIVLEYTTSNPAAYPPDTWDWWDLVAPDVNEAISIVSVEDIEPPPGHVEEIGQKALDELTEIAQKHNMGY